MTEYPHSTFNQQEIWQNHYTAVNQDLWQGRVYSDLPERFNQVVKFIDLTTNDIPEDENYAFVVVGFECDEGVRRNQGRPGAKDAPNIIRSNLANMPFNYANNINVYDVGNITCNDHDLESAQQALGEVVSKILLAGCHPIVLGGGHETSFGHYQGIADTDYTDNLGIINFDSHFDLRPLLNGDMGTSGTPFTQIAESREFDNLDFDYFCIGIQSTANTLSLYEEAEVLGVEYIEADDLVSNSDSDSLEAFASFIAEHETLYVSICMDVFSAAVAPGVSAVQPLGLMPQDMLPFLRLLAASDKVISLDVVELAPQYDQNNVTAKLSAQLIADYIDTVCLEDE